ncbi:hypothetical protein ACEPAF_7186 [Sanghuangporus sanghuang]
MACQALCDRFCISARNYASLLSGYNDSSSTYAILKISSGKLAYAYRSNSGIPNLVQKKPDGAPGDETFSAQLKQAETEMEVARTEWEHALDNLRRAPISVEHPPRALLPLELIQYIVALALNSGHKVFDFRTASATRGAASLLAVDHPAHIALLSTAALPIIANYSAPKNPRWANLDEADQQIPGELEVEFHNHRSEKDYSVLRFVLQHARQVKSLEIYNEYELDEQFAPLLPFLRHFAFIESMVWNNGPDLSWLAEKAESWERINLRSASIASPYLEYFISSGYLRGITNLTVPLVPRYDGAFKWPFPYDVLKVLPELTKLVSLSFHEYLCFSVRPPLDAAPLNKWICSERTVDMHLKFPPLRHLRLKITWGRMLHLISEFESCDLKELSLHDSNHKFEGDEIITSCRRLSDMYPGLEILHFPTYDIRRILIKASGDNDELWNFPQLHTLDIRGSKPPRSAKQLIDVVEVIKARAAQHNVAMITSSTIETVEPINSLLMTFPSLFHIKGYGNRPPQEEETLKSQRALMCLELERIVPNFMLRRHN